ncbi:(1-_4)-alpha-D-glucan 1-alpha-D-glucosylmutase [Amycolatopsis bartoniae]|uniref:Malto-oligosyltrehalose synthase n=1 Tax=Amycolatopsis bartoniae TaxID=941986 RepID=A0A8H9J103_9PSEU|nr:malto-oligosyltrehalose synthase [Amycolatopsis bartoniae]MBB2936256.1 (1->4)-alpha-D-glucan 1-alpha-D-glucosylmutase [Amycolatopsis bartoniae]TVT11583.1 malto-oligosyltrehalose synthase [Amycolatopsis bartoniae]GHF80436.1 malto-oligosyltrehalose synthase [Amycolatopsis bartoniae]
MTPPSSTYRLQLRPEFTFADAEAQVDYLRRLGVGALYASPVLDATPGSTHGYDVVDPTRARPELGGEEARKALSAKLREAGLGFVVDIVPNHMAVEVAKANPWWWDVLRHGRDSAYAGHFDIDWSRGRILLPVLGDDDAVAELKVEDSPDGHELVYYDHRFPIAPGTEGGSPQEVHARQHYELVGWRRGNAELNYRRFFDITTLAAVRVEVPEVFADTHGEVLRWVADGEVTGLRVDHPDGLADPGGYMRRLREGAPGAWLVVEKILHPGEDLPQSWPVDGTTGYDALREISGLFVDPAGAPRFSLLAGSPDYAAVEEEARRLVTDSILVAEMRRIGALVGAPDAPAAVAELMIAFPVYRSYLPEGEPHWAQAVQRAKEKRPELASTVDEIDRRVRAEPHGELATRIQQTSGMVVAKGTEDTTFYRYTRFAALNEVGGSPADFGTSVAEFHESAAAREAGWPTAMTTLTTHDTKRSEDVRARLAVLSEIPDEFADAVERWTATHGIDEPSLNLLAWQTLVGAWPISADRLRGYLDKAAKEAKIRTTWTDHDEAFEQEVAEWPDRVLGATELGVEEFVERIKGPGWSNALGQKLVQLTAPGVPDVYQGTELWDLSLVDPDNRRPVDYGVRRQILDRIEAGELPEVDDTGAAKLLVVHRTLTLRRDHPELFRGYKRLHAEGPAAEHALAFERNGLVVVATRLPVGLANGGGWRNTVLPLPPGEWTDVFTGTSAAGELSRLLSRYPVALLVRGD